MAQIAWFKKFETCSICVCVEMRTNYIFVISICSFAIWFISATVHTIQIDKHIQLLSAFNFSPLIKYRNWYRFYQKKYSNSRWKWNRNKSIFQGYLIEPKITEPCHYFRFLNIETDLLIEKASCHEHGLQICRWVICQPDPTTQCQTGSCFSSDPRTLHSSNI